MKNSTKLNKTLSYFLFKSLCQYLILLRNRILCIILLISIEYPASVFDIFTRYNDKNEIILFLRKF